MDTSNQPLLWLLLPVWNKLSCSPGWPQILYIAEGDLRLLVLADIHIPPYLHSVALIEPRASSLLGKLHPFDHTPDSYHVWLYRNFIQSCGANSSLPISQAMKQGWGRLSDTSRSCTQGHVTQRWNSHLASMTLFHLLFPLLCEHNFPCKHAVWGIRANDGEIERGWSESRQVVYRSFIFSCSDLMHFLTCQHMTAQER